MGVDHQVTTEFQLETTHGAWPLLSAEARDVATRLTLWGVELEPFKGPLIVRASDGVMAALRASPVMGAIGRHRDELWRLAVEVRRPIATFPELTGAMDNP